jgi:hypothetical protein
MAHIPLISYLAFLETRGFSDVYNPFLLMFSEVLREMSLV